MSEIIEFTKDKFVDYPQEQELYSRLLLLVHEYNGEISYPSAIGVVELVSEALKNEQ